MSKILEICTLTNEWADKDEVLLHAAFQILVDFIEKEQPDEIIDWSWSPEYRHVWGEIKNLYHWWTKVRPVRFDPLLDDDNLKCPPLIFETTSDDDFNRLVSYDRIEYKEYETAFKESQRLGELWFLEDQRNLHRLINIRIFLWV